MSKIRRNLDFLLDIKDAIERILNYTSDLTWEKYLSDLKTQDAVVRNLEVIGEAAKNLTDDFRTQYSNIPWRDITGTRDRLTHHYFGVNQEVVWQIITQDLLDLKKQIEQVIREFSEGEF